MFIQQYAASQRFSKRFFSLLITSIGLIFLYACSPQEADSGSPRVLVFTKTMGFRHESIPAGINAIIKLGAENGFQVDTTENAAKFTEENLKKYSAVIFLSTTQDVLNHVQQADFERYIQAGGGFVGIHAAADTEYSWPWYNKLVGAYFLSHPNNPNVRKAAIDVTDRSHISTKMLPARWERTDEWYNYKSINPDIKVLANLDEKTYQGGENGDNHPIAWYHEFDGGRAFYTGGGHTSESFSEPLFLQHILGGINYAIGNKPKLAYDKVRTSQVPDDSRFVKIVLDQKLDEPMELAIAPDGRVFYVERRGNINLYDPQSNGVTSVGKLDVFYRNNDGLLGIALDPAFSQNNWVYLYYSPAGKTPKQHLSRFTFKDGKIDMASEKVMLEVPTQRDECCHSGGSLVFDKQGNLFISLGDNTSVGGTAYAPIDERPGRSAWDAQRTSANTNDLRGKILRIHPEPNGTYTIPEGNLFPKGMAKTRPEIYVMGNRNPFRISVDNKTGFLYWGEIGPDAGKDSIVGPQSYDEFNQARKAGNYGWPYFVGNNKAYPDLDFGTNKVGAVFNPEAPINNSPNNTGLKQLPPAQLPMIWYPYTESQEFPVLGKGGRNAMAGQVFYSDEYKNSSRKFPDYYNGKWFIYEWMRNWIMVVTMDEEGKLVSIEPFAPTIEHMKPMDMQFSPDGDLYMLEYGSYWYSQNEDARLVRIEYNAGNRKPVVQLAADKRVGAAPLTVQFSSKGTFDRDGDKLRYHWQFTPDAKVESTEENQTYTFQQPGIYTPKLSVIDAKGDTSSVQVEIKVGNEPPQIAFQTNANTSFFWDQGKIDYQVKVTDKEDTAINSTKVLVSFDYLAQGSDIDLIEQDYQAARASLNYQVGKNLIEGSDCKACHAMDKKSVGPSYMQVAERYKGDTKALDFLSRKIISGGGGNWDHMVMSAHPQLTLAQTNEMVKYILSLAENTQVKSSFPSKGTFITREHIGKGDEGTYIISASYTDAGGKIVGPLTNRKIVKLRYPRLQAEDFDTFGKVGKRGARDATRFVTDITNGSFISFNEIDLSKIAKLTFNIQAHAPGGNIEIRLDSPQGKQIGMANVPASSEKGRWSMVEANIEKTEGRHNLYLVFTHPQIKDKKLFDLDWIYFHPASQILSTDASSRAHFK